MELLQLRYFCHAAHTENFTKTAEQLHIPQSAVSRTVANLEKELGCTLFDRAGKKVVLNERGNVFLHAVEGALNSIDHAVQELSLGKDRTIRLQVLAGTKLIPDLLVAYSEINPNVRFILQQQAEHKDYDLRITAKECAKNHSCITLLSERIVLAIPKGHPLYDRERICVEELRKERFVGLEKRKDMRKLVDAYCTLHGFVPNVVLEAENAATFRALVEQHSGIAFVPEKVFQSSPARNLRLIPLKDNLERTIILEWKDKCKLDKQMKDFCDFAVRWFQQIGS